MSENDMSAVVALWLAAKERKAEQLAAERLEELEKEKLEFERQLRNHVKYVPESKFRFTPSRAEFAYRLAEWVQRTTELQAWTDADSEDGTAVIVKGPDCPKLESLLDYDSD
jgi:hypothetical protein